MRLLFRTALFLSAPVLILPTAAAELKLGKPLTLKQPTSIAELNAKPDPLVGKTVQTKGRITEVCQMMGCWMALIDPATQATMRVKVNDGDILFPKDSVGKMAVTEGTLVRFVLTKEQAIARARHEAEEQGRKFDPSKVTGGTTIYQIQGTGAVIFDESR